MLDKNSTSVRTGTPVPRAGVKPWGVDVLNAGPAMSTCAHWMGGFTNSRKKHAADNMPPCRFGVAFRKSATGDFTASANSSGSGIAHAGSSTSRPICANCSANSASPITPDVRSPNATICAPVNVATSTQHIRLLLARKRQRIRQHQPTLRISIENFRGLLAIMGDDIPRPVSRTTWHILRQRYRRRHRDR